MDTFSRWFHLFLVFVLAGRSDLFAAASDVLDLGDSDFEYTAAEQETMLVEFFAPW